MNAGQVWFLQFTDGATTTPDTISTPNNVRCVRGIPINPSTRYTDESGGTLTGLSSQVWDQVTNLIWQRTESGTVMTWSVAKAYCGSLPLGGATWRLPTIKEYTTIVDFMVHSPSINAAIFFGTVVDWHYSSTPYAGSPGVVWDIGFSDGYIQGSSTNYYVRCVR